jgi:hypothetical protein
MKRANPKIHNRNREYGFRACAKGVHPGMTLVVSSKRRLPREVAADVSCLSFAEIVNMAKTRKQQP